jgi:hypothetical protein
VAQYLCRMNILKLLFELFLFYMLYKLVFDFIIPVYRASKRMKEQVGQMQQKMHEQQQKQQREDSYVNTKAAAKPSGKDYIDFEEVK